LKSASNAGVISFKVSTQSPINVKNTEKKQKVSIIWINQESINTQKYEK
jgi:hypothetical protein